jgi:regulator of telomere elongation helicase 1
LFSCLQNVEDLRRCCNMLLEVAQDALAGDGGGGAAASLAVEPKLQAFTLALDRVIRSLRTGRSEDYRVYIADEVIKYNPAGYNQHVTATGAPPPRSKRVVNYWCFSTGVAMMELQSLGVKSMLLTSGTLSPMAALREDIKIPFAVQLENPHVIRYYCFPSNK